jgi:AraC-like DNA-binding protein
LRDGGPVSELVTVTEEALRRRRPRADPNVALVSRITRTLLTDRSISRVDDAARRFGLSMRTLQRLFQTYVGVSPKWVLGRYRLHEAAARLAAGSPGSTWADVAAELGYFDQSHFIRDFTRAVGSTPADYAAACARGRVTALTT